MVHRVQQTDYFDDTAHRCARPPLDVDFKAAAPGLTGLVRVGAPGCRCVGVGAMVPIISLRNPNKMSFHVILRSAATKNLRFFTSTSFRFRKTEAVIHRVL